MGSKLGWVLAGALLLGVAAFVAFRLFLPARSEPTAATLKPGVLEFKDVGISPATISGIEPAGPGNAGDDFAQAAALMKQHLGAAAEAMSHIQEIAQGQYAFQPALLDALKKVDALVAAGAAKAMMQYVLEHSPKELRCSYVVPAATDLQNVAGGLDLLANHYHGKQQTGQAVRALQHEFALGWHMMQERALPDMVQRGIAIQKRTLGGLVVLYSLGDGKNEDRIAAIKKYQRAMIDIIDAYDAKMKVCASVRPNPGDVFNLIENDKDRAWRVQGLLTLAIVKFTAAQPGDMKHLEKVLGRFEASTEPLEAGAARAARAFTKVQFNQAGTKNFYEE